MYPATEKQKKYLDNLGVTYKSDITVEEASRLIGSQLPAEDYDKSILKYFKIPLDKDLNQTEAKDLIAELFNNKDNKAKWKNRNNKKALKEELTVLKFFNVDIPKNIDLKTAYNLVCDLLEDPIKEKQWEDHELEIEAEEDKIEQRKEAIADVLDEYNYDKKWYDCKRISKKIFTQFVEEMELKGYTLEQIGNIKNYDTFFPLLLDRFPELRK